MGISAYYHDSAACLLQDGQVSAAVQEERFSRIKHDSSFPKQSIEYCLKAGDISIEDLDHVLLMTVNPGFKGQALVPQAIDKIKDLKQYINQRGLDVAIHVDGNVSIENIPTMVSNGGDTLISGSSGMFMKDLDLKDSIKIFRDAISRGLNARS